MFRELYRSTLLAALILLVCPVVADSLPAPTLTLSLQNNMATASWNKVGESHYTLYYAPYPSGTPIGNLNMGDKTSLSVTTNTGDAFYVAVKSQLGGEFSNYSNIEHFITPADPQKGTVWYKPTSTISWQWQLQGKVNPNYAVTLYDIDLFDTPEAQIQALQASGKKVICYFSAGSYENWRNDKANFKASELGKNLDDWEGERWLDIRSANVLDIMTKRLDLAAKKGCDGVEPDNVDGYANQTGFALTNKDQLAFNKALATAAHQRGLAIGLKNDLDQVNELVDFFDFSVNEECHVYNECDSLKPFIDANKAVLNAEYTANYKTTAAQQALCATAKTEKLNTLILPLSLDDSFRFACQ